MQALNPIIQLHFDNTLKSLKMRYSVGAAVSAGTVEEMPLLPGEIEIHYQEPPESYLGKFKRSWVKHFRFLICMLGFMVSVSVVLFCF